MRASWLVVDGPYLCHRAYHALNSENFAYKGVPTGVVYGFLRDLVYLEKRFGGPRFAFCWDHGQNLRKKLCRSYKVARGAPCGDLSAQIELLKHHLLSEVGFRNHFWQEGYEADDLIAVVLTEVKDSPGPRVIVSADKDLYQLLDGDEVVLWNPHAKRLFTADDLGTDFAGATPGQWAKVKALAGCTSDGVRGLAQVGEKSAAKWLNGTLGKGCNQWRKLEEESPDALRRNLILTRLPFPGCNKVEIKEDEFSVGRWNGVVMRYGMRSLLRQAPD